jgi:hypothetical protein
LEARIPNPTLLKVINNAAIPVAAKIAQTYYGLTRDEQIGEVIWKLSKA